MVIENKNDTFENRVKKALIDRNMTQTDLANELGISAAYLSDLLNQKRTGAKAQERIKTIKKYLNIY